LLSAKGNDPAVVHDVESPVIRVRKLRCKILRAERLRVIFVFRRFSFALDLKSEIKKGILTMF
jgi:hypothetical protein